MAQVPDTDVSTVSVGGTGYTIPFIYQDRADVVVEVDGTPAAFTWINDGNISISPAPPAGLVVRRYRNTPAIQIRHDYRNGVPFTPKNIAENNDQLLFAVQEAVQTAALAASGAVVSFKGRTGAVMPQTGDYTATQISGLGTAAVADTQTSGTDATAGRVLLVGADASVLKKGAQSLSAYLDALPGGFTLDQTLTGSFWSDDPTPARVHRITDRVLVGDAVVQNGRKSPGVSKSWVGHEANGFMTYFESRSQVEVVNTAGSLAVAAASRTSDNPDPGNQAAIGFASYVRNDSGAGKSAWAYYAHARHDAGSEATHCMEVDIANTSEVTQECHPYLMGATGICTGLWVRSGGETAESGVPVRAASVAIGIARTASANATFGKGIVFQANAITGADGVTGTAPAIEMAKGHVIRWTNVDGAGCSSIYSNNVDATRRSGIQFEPDAIWLTRNNNLVAVFEGSAGSGNYMQFSSAVVGVAPQLKAEGLDTDIDLLLVSKGTGRAQIRQSTSVVFDANVLTVSLGAQAGSTGEILRATRNGSAVNYVNVTGGAAGANPGLSAAGADANLDLNLNAKGSGVLKFGTWTSNADAAVNGYITIKDAAGNLRKLATIA